jgi:hypothetical protein
MNETTANPNPVTAPAPTAAPVAAAAPQTVKMVRYQNISAVALPIPELNVIVPKDGFSPPLPEATPTLKAYVTGQLFKAENVDIPTMGMQAQAVTQGDVNANDNQGVRAPLVAGPGQPTAKVDYSPIKVSTTEEKLKGYDNSAEVKKALANTVISVGSEQNPINLFGEIPADEAVRLIKAQGNGSFSTEVSGGEYIADEAQKIIASAAGVSSVTARPIPMPEGLPADLVPFFQQTGLQKKIFIYKTPNWEMLNKIQGFERDANVLSCIKQRLAELGK